LRPFLQSRCRFNCDVSLKGVSAHDNDHAYTHGSLFAPHLPGLRQRRTIDLVSIHAPAARIRRQWENSSDCVPCGFHDRNILRGMQCRVRRRRPDRPAAYQDAARRPRSEPAPEVVGRFDLKIARSARRKSAELFSARFFADQKHVSLLGNGLRFVGTRQLKKGSVHFMSGKAPRGGNAKKEPKLSLKEKREVKRENVEPAFLKPRKTR